MMSKPVPFALPYALSREKGRTRDRGWIYVGDLPRSPKADAVRADIMDRLKQHEAQDTLPRGPRGLFYDLCPAGRHRLRPPKKGAPPGRAAALPRQDRTSAHRILAPRRAATAKAPPTGTAFAVPLAQELGECLARIIAADSTGGEALLDTYSRALRVMTAAKRRSRRWRRRTLKGGD